MDPIFAENNVAGWEYKQLRTENPFLPWTELPDDVTANILHRLGAIEILENAQRVCKTWRRVCKDPSMWYVIDMRNDGDPLFDKWVRHAVDRSQGHLVDINLEIFGDDKLLEYIAGRSGKLRRLQLPCCFRFLSDEGLIKAIKGFPLLEELHLFVTPFDAKTIETVGRLCPLLSSFSYGGETARYFGDDDNYYDKIAFAIARSMPKLRHLHLFKHGLTNEGLEAILDGCPHLESLGLRHCYHVYLYRDQEMIVGAKVDDLIMNSLKEIHDMALMMK